MATRMDKYKELRDGMNDEAKLNRERVENVIEDEEDDYLSFLSKREEKEENVLHETRAFDESSTRMDILNKIRGGNVVKEEKKQVSLLDRIAAMKEETKEEVKEEVIDDEEIKKEEFLERIKERDVKEVEKVTKTVDKASVKPISKVEKEVEEKQKKEPVKKEKKVKKEKPKKKANGADKVLNIIIIVLVLILVVLCGYILFKALG